jgi:hypothetical protein
MTYFRPGPRLARRTNGRTSNISDATNFLAHTSDDSDDGVNPNPHIKFRTFLETGSIFLVFPSCPGPHAPVQILAPHAAANIGWPSA